MKKLLLGVLILTTVNCGSNNMKIKVKEYPVAPKDNSVVDNYFGVEIADPYRPLEDDRSEETAKWVIAENEVTNDYLSQIPYREEIKERLSELYNYPKFGVPEQYGEYLIYSKNDGLQNQSIIYKQKNGDNEEHILLDPNTLSDKGTVALVTADVSQDNRYLAYALSESGSDWVTIMVKDIESGEVLSDTIKWVKFSGAVWSGDGFYYSRYDAPAGSELSAKNEYQKVYYHKLGTAQSSDQLIYENKEHPLRYFSAYVSGDNKHLFIISSEGTSGTEVMFKENHSSKEFKTLFKGFEYDYSPITCNNGELLMLTNDGAENMQLIKTNLNTLKSTTLIAEDKNLLESVTKAGDMLFATYLINASSHIYKYNMDGERIEEITLPTLGTAKGFSAKKDDTETYYSFSSFNYPSQIYKLDIKSGKSSKMFNGSTNFNPEDFVVEQQFCTSKDGAKIPLFIVYKKGIVKDGSNPVHIYGYGGFNINITPSFAPQNIMFMEQGGIYVVVTLRGGGEYGETWHKAGMKENKQNVFNDFIAAAEYMTSEGYTTSARTAISGGSNGGLLVGAALTQRPDLYAVAFPRVGVLDMLRYHKFTIGWGWVVEYGSSDNKEDFDYLIKYSPLHNIKEGTCYPATMVMTADHDDRVVPAHSFKFGATLQQAQGCDNPILIRIDSNAGHGAGKPISKTIKEQADLFSFMFFNMNYEPKFNK